MAGQDRNVCLAYLHIRQTHSSLNYIGTIQIRRIVPESGDSAQTDCPELVSEMATLKAAFGPFFVRIMDLVRICRPYPCPAETFPFFGRHTSWISWCLAWEAGTKRID